MYTRYPTEFTEEKNREKVFSQSFGELAKYHQNIPNMYQNV